MPPRSGQGAPGGGSSSSSPAGSTGGATAVQLAGTVYFNVSTGNAVRVDLTAKAANQHVWRPRRRRLGLLPGGQRAGLVRGLPRLGRVAPAGVVMVDHPGEPDRLGGLRRIRCRRLHQPRDRPAAQRRALEPGHPGRCRVLPRRVRCCSCPSAPRNELSPDPGSRTARNTATGRGAGGSRDTGTGVRVPVREPGPIGFLRARRGGSRRRLNEDLN